MFIYVLIYLFICYLYRYIFLSDSVQISSNLLQPPCLESHFYHLRVKLFSLTLMFFFFIYRIYVHDFSKQGNQCVVTLSRGNSVGKKLPHSNLQAIFTAKRIRTTSPKWSLHRIESFAVAQTYIHRDRSLAVSEILSLFLFIYFFNFPRWIFLLTKNKVLWISLTWRIEGSKVSL